MQYGAWFIHVVFLIGGFLLGQPMEIGAILHVYVFSIFITPYLGIRAKFRGDARIRIREKKITSTVDLDTDFWFLRS